jgi:tetratricopeptide (TPR) repeat protein
MDRIQKLKEFLKDMPDDSFLSHALALEYIKTGEYTAARGLFEGLLSREPTYIGSYYHLGKLLVRLGEQEGAIDVYTRGMAEAKKAKDNHSYNELQGAYDELMD